MNQITGFIDASNVYGSDDGEARLLRLGRGGRLRVSASYCNLTCEYSSLY